MDIDIVSVFPEYFDVLNLSLLGKAKDKGLISVHAHNLRDWTHDVHQSVDDTPVGGGAGMVMKPAVWAECLDELLGLPADAPAQETALPDRPILIFPNPSAHSSHSRTRPSFRTHSISCSAAGATRDTTRASPSTTASAAWTCANTQSEIMCSTAAKWLSR